MKILQLLLLLLLSWSLTSCSLPLGLRLLLNGRFQKTKRGVAVETILLAVSLLEGEGEGKTLHFLRQTLWLIFRSEVFTNKYYGAICMYVVFTLWIVFCFLVSAHSWIKGLSSHPLLRIFIHLYLIGKWAHHPNVSVIWPFLPGWQKAVFKVSAEMYSWEQDAEQLCVTKLGCALIGEHFFLPSYKAVLINNWAFILNSESTGLFTHTILFPFTRETLFWIGPSFSFYCLSLLPLFILLLLLLNKNINNSCIAIVADS